MSKKITLVITTWNSLETLKLFFKYLYKYTQPIYEIIIVDNGSVDGTKEYLDKNIKGRIIHNSKNVGVVKALNQADKLVKTKYMLSISDDILVSPHWLEDLIKIYESDEKIKTLAPIKPGTKIKYPYSGISSRKVWEDIQNENLNKDKEEMVKLFSKGNYSKFVEDIKKVNNFSEQELECPFDFVSGCCVLVEKEFIDGIGGFSDTRFKIYGCEDVDRCWRVGKAGYKVVRTSKVFVHHLEGVSLKNNKLMWKKLMKENNRILLDKWNDYFWNLFESKLQELGSIEILIEKYWIIQWLLESTKKTEIPIKYQDLVIKYLRGVKPKLT